MEECCTLVSSDGVHFKVLVESMKLSQTITDLIKDAKTDSPIPLSAVDSYILTKVVEFCKDPTDKFAKEFDSALIISLLKAANYLNIEALLKVCGSALATKIATLPADKLCAELGIKKDISKEDEDKIREEHAWIDEV